MANEKRLIDAAPLIDECDECMRIEWNKSVYTTWAEAEEDFMQRLLDAPTVEAVEVVHGRWELHGNDDNFGCSYFCSNCHNSYDEDWFYVHGQYRHLNYCPNCGAKMDGDGNG